MRIALIQIEQTIFNTAYMQIATFYKRSGHVVEFWDPKKFPMAFGLFGKIFCSSLFTYTDKSFVPLGVACGGTGYDVKSRLPKSIEECDLDYSIYPDCRKSFLWFSRGCFRKCPWCVVPEKEGKIRPVRLKNLNPKGEYIVVCDNSFFANPEWAEAIICLQHLDQPLDFQGIDVRTITKAQALVLARLRHHKRIKFAWDVPEDEEKVLAGIGRMLKYLRAYRLMCYVLIGFASTRQEDLHRIKTLRGLGIDPYVMPFDKQDLYQRALARYVNNKRIFKKATWQDYWQRVLKMEKAGRGWKGREK
jgi:hypothetical protein